MKKMFKNYKILIVAVFVAVLLVGINPPKASAVACSLMSASVSPSSGTIGDTVTISWYAQACDHVEIQLYPGSGNPPVIGTGGGAGSMTNRLSGPPEQYTVTAIGTCNVNGEMVDNVACGSRSLSVAAAAPATATVNISNGCTVGGVTSGTWTFSGDGSTGTASATKTVTPASGGSNYSVSFSAPSGYTGSVSPSGAVNLVGGGSATFTTSCTQNPADVSLVLSASPNPYACVDGTTITWTVANATSCTASGGWTGSKTAIDGTHTEVVHPSGATTYSLSCSGGGLPATQSVSVSAPSPSCPASPAVTVTANPTTINSGQSSNVSWSANALIVSCSAISWANNSTALSGTTSQSPVTTTTYSATCTGNDGNTYTGSATVTVNVAGGSAPTVSLSASPTSITTGGSSTLTWTTGNTPTSCTASGGWSGAKTATGGTATVSPTATTTYTLTCANAFGSGSSSATVTVGSAPTGPSAPTVSVSSSPTSITSGNSSTITWSSSGATSCSAPWTSSTATSGTQIVSPSVTTTYTMTCSGAGGSGSGSAAVTVGTGGTAPVVHDLNFNMTINPSQDVTIGCNARPTPATVGQAVTWTTVASGGTLPYLYKWVGTDFISSGWISSNTFSYTYSTPGSKTVQCLVKDQNGVGATTTSQTTQLQVNVKPTTGEF